MEIQQVLHSNAEVAEKALHCNAELHSHPYPELDTSYPFAHTRILI
jgi:hypothetical protein